MSDGVVARCPRCGYERRGIDSARRCPECGGPPPSAIDRDAPLDRFDRVTILAAIRRQGFAGLTQLGIGTLVLALIVGPGPGAVLLAVGGGAVAIGSWVRTDRRLRPPGAAASPFSMLVRRAGPVVAVLVTAVSGAGGGGGGAAGTAIAVVGIHLLLLQAVVVSRQGADLAEWSRDDRAAGLGDLAFTTAMVTVVAAALLQGGRLLGSLTAVPLLDPDGLDRLTMVAVMVGGLSWWLLQTLADALVLAATILCMVHRLEHEDADERRLARDEAWQDDLADRFDDGPGGGA